MTDIKAEQKDVAAPDPIGELLVARELQALKLATTVRFVLVIIMLPLAWALSFSPIDRIVTIGLLGVQLVALLFCVVFIHRRRYLTAVGLTGVVLDVVLLSALPVAWYISLGGGDLPVGLTLKSSITVFSLLLIALNTLPMRPLYPLLVTMGALTVHLVLYALSVVDPNTVFTSSYWVAYSTEQVSSARVVTAVTVLVFVGLMLTLLTRRTRNMIIEAADLQRNNVQLGRYFSPNLVRRLADNPEQLRVGGERKELSFVFTDLQGFTALVEQTDPEVIVPVLNGYLDALIDVAFKHEGTIDKIVGDALHIIFGAPVNQPDHAERAVDCALELDTVAQRYRVQVSDEVSLGLTRIGVNSGTAVVGNFGGEQFFDYTAHGDPINTAARLESANKYIGTRVCVSAETAKLVPGFRGRPVGTLVVQGKRNGIEVLEPVTESQYDDVALDEYQAAFNALLADDASVLERFQRLCDNYPKDALSKFHLRRLLAGHVGALIELHGK